MVRLPSMFERANRKLPPDYCYGRTQQDDPSSDIFHAADTYDYLVSQHY
jgi:hypothetical protein